MHTYCHSTSVNDLWNAIKDICGECLNLVPSKESSTDITNQGLIVQLSAYQVRSNVAITELILWVLLKTG